MLQHYAEKNTFFVKDCSRFIIHYSSRASLTNNSPLLQHHGALSLRVSWKSEPSSSPRFRNSREYSPHFLPIWMWLFTIILRSSICFLPIWMWLFTILLLSSFFTYLNVTFYNYFTLLNLFFTYLNVTFYNSFTLYNLFLPILVVLAPLYFILQQ